MKHAINQESEEREIQLRAAQDILDNPSSSSENCKRAIEILQSPTQYTPQKTNSHRSFSFRWPTKKAFAIGLVFVMMFSTFGFIAGTNMAYPVAYKEGAQVGYSAALVDTANLLQQRGITLDWNQQTDGSYKLVVHTPDGQTSQINVAANLIVEIKDKNGNLKETARGAGTFTNLGKNWTIQQIGSVANVVGTESAPNATRMAYYLSESLTSAGIGVTSQILPSEITDHGLQRAAATSSTFISTGSWNCTLVKTVATGAQSPLIWGLNFTPYADATTGGNSLVAYDTTPGTKALALGDTETETWTISLT